MNTSTPESAQSKLLLAGPVFAFWVGACFLTPYVLLSRMGHGSIFYFIPPAMLGFVGGVLHFTLILALPNRFLVSTPFALLIALFASIGTATIWLLIVEPSAAASMPDTYGQLAVLVGLSIVVAVAIEHFYLSPQLKVLVRKNAA